MEKVQICGESTLLLHQCYISNVSTEKIFDKQAQDLTKESNWQR